MADRVKLYDAPASRRARGEQVAESDGDAESPGWKHFKTGRPLKEKVGDRRKIDGEDYEAIGHAHEEPEELRSIPDDKTGKPAGSGTLRGKEFDRTTNDGVLWRKERPQS